MVNRVTPPAESLCADHQRGQAVVGVGISGDVLGELG